MTTKSVELAIFWLPLIAGVLLGGIAGSAWYGGDKITAIWIAFFGIVCLLLTAALQFQQYAYANLLQPEIELQTPTQRSILTWNPPTSFFIESRAEDQPQRQAQSTAPIIVFENKSNIIGQDASISWELPRFDVHALAQGSQRFLPYDVKVENDTITIGARPPITQPVGLGVTFPLKFQQNVPPIAFLGKRVESWIPIEVWNQALLYFIATLPETAGEHSPPLTFNVTVKWNIPEGKAGAHLRVRAVATNANTPNVQVPALTAYVALTAEKLAE
jgi:hypothetical protein